MAVNPELSARLDLLVASGQLDRDLADFMADRVVALADAVGRQPDGERFSMLCTHTALALQRARRGEAVEEWEASHAGELAAHPRAQAAAREFVDVAADRLGLRLPEQEVEFVALHLAAIEVGAA